MPKKEGSKPVRKTLSVPEAAKAIGIGKSTLYTYLKEGLFKDKEYIIIQRAERVHYLIFEDAIEAFFDRQSGQLQSTERPKRTYNKRKEKWSRKK